MRRLLLACLLMTQSPLPVWARSSDTGSTDHPNPVSTDLNLPEPSYVLPVMSVHQEKSDLVVNLSQAGNTLILEQEGKELARRLNPGAVERFSLPAPTQSGQALKYTFRLLTAKGKEIARQTVNVPVPAMDLQLHVSANQVFGTHLKPVMVSSGPGTLHLLLDGQSIHSQTIDQKGTFVMPSLPLAPGRHRLQAQLQAGKRLIDSPPVQIFSFGIEPLDHDWLLADKYNFTLYWIRQGVLYRIYPVATGRPGLPTQPGFWLIGGKDVWFPESDWGSFRLRIYRENQYLTHWSGYAVHGTNKPNSIGTEASHGCLRMFNKDVTELYQGVQVGIPLQIEEKLPVYIDAITPAATAP